MRTLAKLAAIEIKLFLREPLTLVFAFALPVILLFVLGGIFGDQVESDEFRGVRAIAYYVPSYIALVAASVAFVSVPTHLAGNRERGMLRRLHASAVPGATVLAANLVLVVLLATASGGVLVLAAALTFGLDAPAAPLALLGAHLLSTLSLGAMGLLLGAVLPTARAAQALGLLLWFVMLLLGGAGPPPETLTGALGTIRHAVPLTFASSMLQDLWLGFSLGTANLAALVGLGLGCGALAVWFFRWE